MLTNSCSKAFDNRSNSKNLKPKNPLTSRLLGLISKNKTPVGIRLDKDVVEYSLHIGNSEP